MAAGKRKPRRAMLVRGFFVDTLNLLIQEQLFQIPTPRLITDVLGHLFDLQIIVQSPLAEFPADAAVFHPAPRRLDEGRLRAVDPDNPRPQLIGHTCGALQIRAHHRCGEAEAAGIGHLHGLFFGLEALDAQHRTEHFFAPEDTAVSRFVEDRRFDEIAFRQMRRPPASSEQAGATGEALIDETEDFIVLALADQRAEQYARLHTRTHGDLAGFFDQSFDQSRGDVFLHQQT